MTSPVTKRRLNDGNKAIAVSADSLSSLSLVQLQRLREIVFDGALAMQSLDDLGSKEANIAAWDDCKALDAKLKRIDDEIARRKTP